ncbi:hypothetical protein JW964_13045, partial [candidate division KSB1 bacterium]|nr:hypothetical protein [candidate division KSB1 bacterium]
FLLNFKGYVIKLKNISYDFNELFQIRHDRTTRSYSRMLLSELDCLLKNRFVLNLYSSVKISLNIPGFTI